MQTLVSLLRTIPSPDNAMMLRAQQHIDGLPRPPGSLGRLESLVVQLAGMPGLKGVPHASDKAMPMMCTDHGVWDGGIAVSPKVITAIQAVNITRGTASVCILAAQAGAKVHMIDVGANAEPIPGAVNMRVARGCDNIAEDPAMGRSQAEELLPEVIRCTHRLTKDGVVLFSVGKLGMASTTPAAATVSVLTGSDAGEVVDIGASLPLSRVGNKIDVVRRAITVNQPNRLDGVGVLAKIDGFDLVGMTGVMFDTASYGLPVILDGFLSYSTALAVGQITSQIKPYLILSHFSTEKGARIALTHLKLDPYLSTGIRLGRGSEAMLAISITKAACTMYESMGQLAASNIVLPGGKET